MNTSSAMKLTPRGFARATVALVLVLTSMSSTAAAGPHRRCGGHVGYGGHAAYGGHPGFGGYGHGRTFVGGHPYAVWHHRPVFHAPHGSDYDGYLRHAYRRYALSVGIRIGTLAPRGYYYYDPYCDLRFSTLDPYLGHVAGAGHVPVIQLIAFDTGLPEYVYRHHRGQWLSSDY